LNRLIEARFSSVLFGKVVQPLKRKGCTAEAVEDCPVFHCWAGRKDLTDCHNNFVKRYQWLFGKAPVWSIFPYFHGPLGKAVQFLSLPGEKAPRNLKTRGNEK